MSSSKIGDCLNGNISIRDTKRVTFIRVYLKKGRKSGYYANRKGEIMKIQQIFYHRHEASNFHPSLPKKGGNLVTDMLSSRAVARSENPEGHVVKRWA